MPTSQNSETSNNDDTTKDFIDNYIKDINTYLGDFLKSSQPTYDPNDNSIKDSLPTNTTTTTSSEKEHETQGETTKSSSVSLSELLKSPTKQSLAQKLKISEISTDYFNQKKEIWNGALINCSELHIKLQECMSFGGIFDKASLCIKARRKFWDCMEDQKKFLQDSGYASPGKSLAENDEILYEADLYNISKLDKEEQS
ncbi:15365_t:CDS:2 [Rhizophagus irregularis]|nr:15365_t:CDS:2 [Rhizophagus irregularis]